MKRILLIAAITVLAASGTAAAERMTVAVAVANIRSGPGIDYDIMWKVAKYHPLEIVKKSGAWCLFRDFEGDEGWIHDSLLAQIPAVITEANRCNIRAGPGMQHEVLFQVGKGIPFKILEKKDNWIHIQHADGDQGWIHRSLVW